MVSEKQEAEENHTSEIIPFSNETHSVQEPVLDTLIQSGKFITKDGTIDFAPGYVAELFASYPEISVIEALSLDGFDSRIIGKIRIHKLERMFSMCLAAGTVPCESRADKHFLEDVEVVALRKNPFVETVTPASIRLNENFHLAATALKELTVDRILDIFMLDHRNFTVSEKTEVRGTLDSFTPDQPGISAFGGTVYDACILRRRMEALASMVKEGYDRISVLFQTLTPMKKKQICLWVENLPPDPGHVLTKKAILKQIGISRSVYYQYVKDPDFGTWETRKKEQDEADAGIMKMVADYKGFRKGSRQVYMLLPRLAGRRISLKKIRRIMKAYGIECDIRRPNPSREGQDAYEKEAVKPNILRRRFRLYRPNRVRVTDVTYLYYGDKKRAYGSALMDPVTGRLVAFVVSERNNLEMALETLRVSDSHPCEDGGIFHSDQGTLYKSGTFQKEILERGLRQSMSKKGNCWDNATQESFFGHFKDECEYSSCADIEKLKKRVEEYSWYYNNERGMWERGRMTPVEYEEYLLGLNEEQFGEYLAAEEKKYNEMKKKAAELAKKRYGTLGV
ncbi:MAG: IS3 family transposase [Blautia sp.]|nr:IS3 family transposase [Blautia sp.]